MRDTIDIEKIIELVKEQEPERPDLISALQNCKSGHWTRQGYYQYVNSRNANQPNSDWQHAESIVIEQKSKGDIIIDILKDGRIGGIEFIDLIENY